MKNFEFGNYLYEMRKQKGLSQFQLGALLGVSDKAVSKWENGRAFPQSGILQKLSDILGITVDDLLACKNNSEEEKGIFTDKRLWKEAHNALTDIYGDAVPLEIFNRYMSEFAELRSSNDEIIVYLTLLSKLRAKIRENGEFFRLGGLISSTLIAYVMGISDVNPLRAHYYCPNCKKVEFAAGTKCGWDLPPQKCACGCDYKRDGQDIPYISARSLHFTPIGNHFDIFISDNAAVYAEKTVIDFFADNEVTVITDKERPDVTFFAINAGLGRKAEYSSELRDNLRSVPTFTLRKLKNAEVFVKLEKATGIKTEDIDICDTEILNRVFEEETNSELTKNIVKESKTRSFADLLQIEGLCHGTGAWQDNGQKLVKRGMPLCEVIAYREDVFGYINKRTGLEDNGFAYKIMDDVRRGVYCKGGISEVLKMYFDEIGVEDWFVESISKIRYIFPKAFGVASVRYMLIYMWYKVRFPMIFERVAGK